MEKYWYIPKAASRDKYTDTSFRILTWSLLIIIFSSYSNQRLINS